MKSAVGGGKKSTASGLSMRRYACIFPIYMYVWVHIFMYCAILLRIYSKRVSGPGCIGICVLESLGRAKIALREASLLVGSTSIQGLCMCVYIHAHVYVFKGGCNANALHLCAYTRMYVCMHLCNWLLCACICVIGYTSLQGGWLSMCI